MTTCSPRIGIRVDAGAAMGVGHLMRCLALAEEAASRHVEVVLFGDAAGLAWADRQLCLRGLRLHPARQDPAEFAAQCVDAAVTHLIIDGYHLSPGLGHCAAAAGLHVATLVDGDFGVQQHADLYIDQNLGAKRHRSLPATARSLSGSSYAIVNDRVRSRRTALPAAHDVPRVLVVFGGTDAYDGAPVLVDCVRRAGATVDITVIAPRASTAHALNALSPVAGQRLTVLGGVDDLPELAIGHDLVVSAAGTSLWEWMCLGLPIAAVCVTDNQLVGYEKVVAADVVVPLGLLEPLRAAGVAREHAVEQLRIALTDGALRDRLARKGAKLVDGDGRVRVMDTLLTLGVR